MGAPQIQTVKSGQEYRVNVDGNRYTFVLNADRGAVFIYTPNHCLGGYLIGRFDDNLSPQGIRTFLSARKGTES